MSIKKFNIPRPNNEILDTLQFRVDNKIKPLGSLGMLEEIAVKAGLVQQTLEPELRNPNIIVFAGDHGIAKDGVSAYPQEVTYQMVMGFVRGGTAIGVFTRQHNIQLQVVDAGVNFDFTGFDQIVHQKVDFGTQSFLKGPAMSWEQLELCLRKGSEVVSQLHAAQCNVVGFGEMGIGNTASASMIMSRICGLDIEACVGRGAGLDESQLQKKFKVLKKAERFHGSFDDPWKVLRVFGGFEIAQICGAMLEAASRKMLILVDGFIVSSAFLVVAELFPQIKDYAIISHQSGEKGHQAMIDYLGMKPVLNLGMRLGEGTGCAMAFPIVQSAVKFLNDMASFEDAGVSKSDEV